VPNGAILAKMSKYVFTEDEIKAVFEVHWSDKAHVRRS
jgi:hypothetical protein